MKETHCKFTLGQLVHHKLFHYRGVVFDIDGSFQGTEEWYKQVARSRPPKDAPWYHVLVHGSYHTTYVAERNLELDFNKEPIDHPMVEEFFSHFVEGNYIARLN